MVSDARVVWHLNSTLGSSLIASPAYQKWPTKVMHSAPLFNEEIVSSYQFKV